MIDPDPEYDFIPPIPPIEIKGLLITKGKQCGECGMKFEYNTTYGYSCGHQRCPMGYGS